MPDAEPGTAWITTGDAAARLGVRRSTVTRWCREGRLACMRLPTGTNRIDPAAVDAILRPVPPAQGQDSGAGQVTP